MAVEFCSKNACFIQIIVEDISGIGHKRHIEIIWHYAPSSADIQESKSELYPSQ